MVLIISWLLAVGYVFSYHIATEQARHSDPQKVCFAILVTPAVVHGYRLGLFSAVTCRSSLHFEHGHYFVPDENLMWCDESPILY